ncbi:MAG: LacI family DNA-binding transcriptional regulator [Phycisphaerae bacterium]
MRTPKNANKVYLFVRRGIEMGSFRIGERIPTERDLADRFGLSRPTVSAAIQRLVREGLIRRSGKAGSVVLTLPPRRSLTFGAILLGLARQSSTESIFGAVGSELAHRAGMHGSAVLLRDPTFGDNPLEIGLAGRFKAIAEQFLERKVDGVFIMPQEILDDQYVSPTITLAEEFKAAGISVVLIDNDIMRYPRRSLFDLVEMDNFGAGYILAKHFLNLGCRRIDFLGQLARNPTQQARIAGYQRALTEHNISSDSAAVHYGNLHDRDFILPILQRRKPQVVLVVGDFRAASVMRFALEAGITIPGELRLGSFDDIPMAAHLPVPLTTIHQPAVDIGAAAYQIMLQRLAEPDRYPMNVQIRGELIVRASSGPKIAGKTATESPVA